MAKNITDDNFNEKDAFDFEDSRNYLITKSNKRAWSVAIFSLAVTVCLAIAIMLITPLKTVELAVVKVDKNGQVDILTNLAEEIITPDEALNKHFIGQYVKLREQYYFTTLNADFEKVQLYSNPTESKKYVDSMVNKNYGKATVLKNKVEIDVKLLSIVTREVAGEQTATIRADVITKDSISDSITNLTTKVITLTFEYLPMKLNTKSRLENPLGFIVTSYRIDEEMK